MPSPAAKRARQRAGDAGSPQAWPHVKPIFPAICAKAMAPRYEWVGEGGAGHFVKMVHNGIEYGDMQLICEAYAMMKELLDCRRRNARRVFRWNQEELNSYLIEITAKLCVAGYGRYAALDKILDTSGSRGTGKWTGIAALG